MKKITTLLCGAAMAAALAAPVHAGGKSTTGSATTVPASVLVAVKKYLDDNNGFGLQYIQGQGVVSVEKVDSSAFKITLANGVQFELLSTSLASLILSYFS